MRRSIPSALAAVMALSMLACGGDDGVQPSGTARLSSTAKVSIIEPTEGTVIQGTIVRVRIKLDGGKIVREVSSNLKPDEGHIHLLLDGRVVQLLGSLDERLDDIAPGAHLLQVEFVAADHGPFSPRVISAVSFDAA